jgi:hypothetical protein
MSNPSGNDVIMSTGIRFVYRLSDDRIMPKLRFDLASLLFVVFIFGVGFAALRESSGLWQSGLFTLTLSVLLVSILLAVHGTESRRAFSIGFALFGWVYFQR